MELRKRTRASAAKPEEANSKPAAEMPVRSRRTRTTTTTTTATTADESPAVAPANGKRRRTKRGGAAAEVDTTVAQEGGTIEVSTGTGDGNPSQLEDSITVVSSAAKEVVKTQKEEAAPDTRDGDKEDGEGDNDVGEEVISSGPGRQKRRKVATSPERSLGDNITQESEAAEGGKDSVAMDFRLQREMEESKSDKGSEDGNVVMVAQTEVEGTSVEAKEEEAKIQVDIPAVEAEVVGKTPVKGRGRAGKRKVNSRETIDDEDEAGNGSPTKTAPVTPKRSKRSNGKEKATDMGAFSPAAKNTAIAEPATSTGAGASQDASQVGESQGAAEAVGRRRRAKVVVYDERSDKEDADEEEVAVQETPKKAARSNSNAGQTPKSAKKGAVGPAPTSPQKARKGRKSPWDKEVLLTSKKSKLADASDLTDVLNSSTWDLLTPVEQAECLALLPAIDKNFYPTPVPTSTPPSPSSSSNPPTHPIELPTLMPDFFESNQVFKDSLVEFQDDLLNGRYEPGYVSDAKQARKDRLEGLADKYKDGQFELYWGQRARSGMVAGAAAMIKLPELAQRGVLKEGDVWAFRRRFGDVVIEKEVKVARIDKHEANKFSLAFHVPPGDAKFSQAKRADLVLEGVVSPQTVETFILRNHSRTPAHVPNGNAYKCFNVWRKGEDLGLLWEVRQVYWGGA